MHRQPQAKSPKDKDYTKGHSDIPIDVRIIGEVQVIKDYEEDLGQVQRMEQEGQYFLRESPTEEL